MIGTINNVDSENNNVTVSVEMFGRETSVDLEFNQVRKITQ